MTWPGSKNETVNYRLATSGAIRDTAFEYDDVALFAIEYLMERYPANICKAYQLKEVAESPLETLEEIAKRRGCMQRGGPDYQRAGELVVHDLRAGKLGKISLEAPGAECELVKVS
jgi:ribosome biogenesis GTPase A